MNGHESIIALRMRGHSPGLVWVYVFDIEPHYFPGTHPSLSLENGFRAEIHVTPRDKSVIDFRCLTGLVVLLQGSSEHRVLQVLRHIERARPARTIATLSDRIVDSAVSTAVQEEIS